MKTLIASLLIAVTLSACGWHLRGSTPKEAFSMQRNAAPMELKVVSAERHGPLVTNLRVQYHAFNVHETDSSDAATLVLQLNDLKLDKRAAGVGADALVNMYELTLSVNYQVERGDKVLTKANTRAMVSRTFNFEVNQVSYSEQEEALILREMHRELASQILRRLRVLNQ